MSYFYREYDGILKQFITEILMKCLKYILTFWLEVHFIIVIKIFGLISYYLNRLFNILML